MLVRRCIDVRKRRLNNFKIWRCIDVRKRRLKNFHFQPKTNVNPTSETDVNVTSIQLILPAGMVLEKKMKMWKVYRQKDEQTGMDRWLTPGDQKNSLELSPQVS